MTTRFLNEEQVPGASLRGRDVTTLKVPELKRWLQCRRASTKGLKAIWLQGIITNSHILTIAIIKA